MFTVSSMMKWCLLLSKINEALCSNASGKMQFDSFSQELGPTKCLVSSTSLTVRLLKWLGWESALLPHFAHEYPRNSCSAVSPPSSGSGLSNGAILTDIFKQEIERLFVQIDAVWASTLPLKHPQHKMALSIQKTRNSHQFLRFRCTQLCLHTSRPRELMRLWRHFRKFDCRFRVGGDFYHSSPNKRSSSVMDRPPERRGAFGWTNFWAQLVDNCRLQHRTTRGDGKATRGSRRLHEFGCFIDVLGSLVCLISKFERADWGWSGVSRAASAVHTLSSRLNAGSRCVFHFWGLFCVIKVCNNVSCGSC